MQEHLIYAGVRDMLKVTCRVFVPGYKGGTKVLYPGTNGILYPPGQGTSVPGYKRGEWLIPWAFRGDRTIMLL